MRQLLLDKSDRTIFTKEKITLNLGKINKDMSNFLISFCLITLPNVIKECKTDTDSTEHISILSKWINIIYETSLFYNDNDNNILSIYSRIKKISAKTTSGKHRT